ncbi:uncharacterized transposon-derived [Paramuricea clavata]|uniref:Uncharacterized transposon-derived n=1 Tax=Paramuricea clavata TaxID=317549 RepID=A0A6S7FYM7_PARCT|nr:uncharacterized transposon-derived [Paramuricea clavata]
MAEQEQVKIYKRERTLVEKSLGTYENGKTKMVLMKQWTKKCGLTVGHLSQGGDKYIYDSGIEMAYDEMETLADVLPTMVKSDQAKNYAELGTSKDSYGNEYRTILTRSEYGGLKVCKLKKTQKPVDFGVTTTTDCPDPAPTASPVPAPRVEDSWVECFDKFYINKNDDWKKLATVIREFCYEVYSILNPSSNGIDVIPPSPPAPPPSTPVEQKQLEGPKKRKNKEGTKGGVKKSKKVVVEEDSEKSEVRKFLALQSMATKLIMVFMCKYKKDCEETISRFGREMYKMCPYPYANFLSVSTYLEETCANINLMDDTELIKKAARLLKGETLTKEQKNLYTLHAKKKHRIKRLKIHVYKKNEQWSIDLADLNNLSKYNNQYRYLLVCIDVGTRYAFVKLLKTKTAKNVAAKFEEIILENGAPKKIQADEGTEFNNIKKILAPKYNFTLFHTQNRDIKAAHAERFIETIKNMIQSTLTMFSSYRFIKYLPLIIERYNEAPHRGIHNETPVDLYKNEKMPAFLKFKILKNYLSGSQPPANCCVQVKQYVLHDSKIIFLKNQA